MRAWQRQAQCLEQCSRTCSHDPADDADPSDVGSDVDAGRPTRVTRHPSSPRVERRFDGLPPTGRLGDHVVGVVGVDVRHGCRTTALLPEDTHSFVRAITEEPKASGIIGTEVAITEDLARPFAEHVFKALTSVEGGTSVTIGEAVRAARLRLLSHANPLGLVYSPFISPDIRLQEVREEMPPIARD